MKSLSIISACTLLLVTLGLLVASPETTAAPDDASTVDHRVLKNLKVSGPVTHGNLAVYFLHSHQRDDRKFLTLNEGLKQKLVKVTELDNEQVNSLVIENVSDVPLFLQEGDRVTGGKQDRTIYTSLVIAAKSGPQKIPTFCVEPSRWQEGSNGRKFVGNFNPGYAANSVRNASKLLKNQSAVWRNVAQTKGQLQRTVGTNDKTSSLNEAQDDMKVTQSTKPFLDALGNAADSHDDLVGVAFAVNGQVQEINIYPGREITKKIYPRLLETYALDAIVKAEDDKSGARHEAPKKLEVLATLNTATEPKPARAEEINEDNGLQIFAASKANGAEKNRLYRCETKYQGKPIHLQWLKGPESIEAVKQAGEAQQRGNNRNFNFRPQQQGGLNIEQQNDIQQLQQLIEQQTGEPRLPQLPVNNLPNQDSNSSPE